MEILNVYVKVGESGILTGIPYVEGDIKNGTEKAITSARIEVLFSKPDGRVVFNEVFNPLEKNDIGTPAIVQGRVEGKNVLLAGERAAFRHIFRNCPDNVVKYISIKSEFARDGKKDALRFKYKLTGLSLL